MSRSDNLLTLKDTLNLEKKVNFDSFIIISDNIRTKQEKDTITSLLGNGLVELTEDLIISES